LSLLLFWLNAIYYSVTDVVFLLGIKKISKIIKNIPKKGMQENGNTILLIIESSVETQ